MCGVQHPELNTFMACSKMEVKKVEEKMELRYRFSNKQKLKKFITTRPVLQEMLKGTPQAEMYEC